MTAPAYQDDAVTVYLRDCLDILPTLPDASIDAIVTDPPYGLDFMGKHWDTGATAFNPDTWRHCLRVLKPGAHMLAFGGTRTWHRLACAIEDAGFEVRDSIAWLYGSGFPKSLDVSKAIDKAAGAEREVIGSRVKFGDNTPTPGHSNNDGLTADAWRDSRPDESYAIEITAPATDAAKQWQGWGTALKPAHEPIILARKPLQGTVAANVLAHGTGALNIDACRVEATDLGELQKNWDRTQSDNQGIASTGLKAIDLSDRKPSGRWPSNVILDPHTATQLDQQSGTTVSRAGGVRKSANAMWGKPNDVNDGMSEYNDSGGASRFFPVFELAPDQSQSLNVDGAHMPVFKYAPKAPTTQRPTADDTAHPTVKPVELCRWLIRLITPPHGLILDPFAGTGSTAEAAIHEHMRAILIEREPTYLPLITARLRKPMQIGFDWETA